MSGCRIHFNKNVTSRRKNFTYRLIRSHICSIRVNPLLHNFIVIITTCCKAKA